jgi:hypothetical protein
MKTSRFHSMRLATVAFLAISATSVFAQGFGGGQGGPPQGGPGGFGGGQGGPGGRGGMRMGMPALDKLPPLISLADRPEVAAELNLTEDQREKIDDIIQTFRESNRPQGGPGGPGGDGPPPQQGGQRGQGFGGGPQDRAARDKAEAAVDAKIKAVLKGSQVKRITEIQIQSMGLTAAMVPSIQAKLGLSDDQKEKLKALVPARPQGGPGGQGGFGGPPPQGGQGFGGGEGFGGPPPQGGQGFGGGQGGRGQGGPGGQRGPGGMQNDARRKELEAKIAAILTDDQEAALKALGGKVIKLQMGGRPGGPGGPGGGPGGPGGGFGGGQGGFGGPPDDPRH